MSDAAVSFLAVRAEFERHLIIHRTSEGRKRARAHGVLFDRQPKLTPHQRREAIARRDGSDETLTAIAQSYNVSHSTISRLRIRGSCFFGRDDGGRAGGRADRVR